MTEEFKTQRDDNAIDICDNDSRGGEDTYYFKLGADWAYEWLIEHGLYTHVKEEHEKLQIEIKRLHRVIAQELTENDELGSEYTYVLCLKEQIEKKQAIINKLKEALEIIAKREYPMADKVLAEVKEMEK